jgi:hypothetical protein
MHYVEFVFVVTVSETNHLVEQTHDTIYEDSSKKYDLQIRDRQNILQPAGWNKYNLAYNNDQI